MVKKGQKLEFADIVLNADAETIKQAYEARLNIDKLLVEREEAYRRISELEEQIDTIVGEESVFPFPEPPVPVASFGKAGGKKVAKKAVKKAEVPVVETTETNEADNKTEENNS